jgi:hypothetical protein
MYSARATGVAAAVLWGFVLVGAAAAQPPTTDDRTPTPTPSQPLPPREPGPGQPAPVPSTPPAPGAPTPPTPTREEERPPAPPAETATEPLRVPEELLPSRERTRVAPPSFVGPNLFNPPAQQGWLTITPSFTLSGEYNDNLFLSSQDRRSDAIIGLTPGVTVSMQRRGFRLLAGYNSSGEIFVSESQLSDFGKEQRFFTDLYYQISPSVSFTLSDQFIYARETSELTTGGVSVGRRDSWRNTVTPQLRWQATQTTALSLFASHTVIRFQDGSTDSTATDDERDSDTYRIGAGLTRQLTARLTGSLNFNFAYFDIDREPAARTYTPTVGIGYDITPTLRASVTGGPTLTEREGDTTVSPAVGAILTQTFKFGSIRVGYDRAVTAETIGLSDRQAIFASIAVPTLRRGLTLEFTPRYAIVDTDVSDTGSSTEVKTLTLTLRATYQIARNISLIGSYTYFHQTERRDEVDQNRVFLGIQYAFPINFY